MGGGVALISHAWSWKDSVPSKQFLGNREMSALFTVNEGAQTQEHPKNTQKIHTLSVIWVKTTKKRFVDSSPHSRKCFCSKIKQQPNIHRENGGTLGMVPLIINPIYKGTIPRGTTIFPIKI